MANPTHNDAYKRITEINELTKSEQTDEQKRLFSKLFRLDLEKSVVSCPDETKINLRFDKNEICPVCDTESNFFVNTTVDGDYRSVSVYCFKNEESETVSHGQSEGAHDFGKEVWRFNYSRCTGEGSSEHAATFIHFENGKKWDRRGVKPETLLPYGFDTFHNSSDVLLAEGEKDVFNLTQAGHAVLNSKQITPSNLTELLRYWGIPKSSIKRNFIFFIDNDAAGYHTVCAAREVLKNFFQPNAAKFRYVLPEDLGFTPFTDSGEDAKKDVSDVLEFTPPELRDRKIKAWLYKAANRTPGENQAIFKRLKRENQEANGKTISASNPKVAQIYTLAELDDRVFDLTSGNSLILRGKELTDDAPFPYGQMDGLQWPLSRVINETSIHAGLINIAEANGYTSSAKHGQVLGNLPKTILDKIRHDLTEQGAEATHPLIPWIDYCYEKIPQPDLSCYPIGWLSRAYEWREDNVREIPDFEKPLHFEESIYDAEKTSTFIQLNYRFEALLWNFLYRVRGECMAGYRTHLMLIGPEAVGKTALANGSILLGPADTKARTFQEKLFSVEVEDEGIGEVELLRRIADNETPVAMVEIAEAFLKNKKNMAAMKAFLTRTTDVFRRMYSEQQRQLPRAFGVTFTSNETGQFAYGTTSTRFYPLIFRNDLESLIPHVSKFLSERMPDGFMRIHHLVAWVERWRRGKRFNDERPFVKTSELSIERIQEGLDPTVGDALDELVTAMRESGVSWIPQSLPGLFVALRVPGNVPYRERFDEKTRPVLEKYGLRFSNSQRAGSKILGRGFVLSELWENQTTEEKLKGSQRSKSARNACINQTASVHSLFGAKDSFK